MLYKSFKHIKKMDLLTQKQANKFSKISNMNQSNKEFFEFFNEWLIEEVIEQIKIDVKEGDLTAIEGLLKHCGNSVLANYLPEL